MSDSDGSVRARFTLRMPHTWILLFAFLIIAALFTHLIPAGAFDRIEVNARQIVNAKSFHPVGAKAAGLFDVLKAFPKGLEQAASIVFFIFMVGGSFFVVQKSGAVDAGIAALVRRTSTKGFLIVPILSIVFAFGGGVYGMAEEVLPFIPALVLLCISLGYDSITGAAIALVATCAGFTGAFLNPFTLGVAQGIAGLPLFSGIELRLVVFATTVLITVLFLALYCKKIKKTPEVSPMYEIDKARNVQIVLSNQVFQTKHQLILLIVLATFAFMVFGVIKYEWYIREICGLFLGMAIIAGLISNRGLNQLAEDFIEGCAALANGALIVGLARGILVILTDANVIDTIIFTTASWIQGFPTAITSLGIYIVQIFISTIVPSGSGMAALTMPVLSPLGDVVGVTRQTTVLAFQFADGFTNVLTPLSGYFMAGLALARIPYQKWVRWIAPLALIWWIVGGAFVVLANQIHYGPF